MKNHNISSVVKNGLCLGCGICQDSCRKNAISFLVVCGENRPRVDSSICNNCGLCIKSCVGIGIDLNKMSMNLYKEDSVQSDAMIGKFIQCYSGYSTDYEVRYHGASGGMVSQMLIYLLEKKYIDGAVVTGFRKDNPLRPYTYIAKNRKEILAGKSSKYCVVSFNGIATEIMSLPGKYVIVGLPCHIQAFRKFEQLHSKFKEKILGYFAIYCSATKSYNSLDYMMWRYDIEMSEISSFTYRDDGCMGYMKVLGTNGQILKKIKCLTYYIPLRGFFNTKRCSLCIDHYGELADICFGDIKTGENDEETIGESSFLVRNTYFKTLIEDAAKDGFIKLDKISSSFLNSTQGYASKHKKGEGIVAAFSFRRFFHLSIPQYDVPIRSNGTFKYLVREMRNYICRFIGKHSLLWPIIKFLDKNKI